MLCPGLTAGARGTLPHYSLCGEDGAPEGPLYTKGCPEGTLYPRGGLEGSLYPREGLEGSLYPKGGLEVQYNALRTLRVEPCRVSLKQLLQQGEEGGGVRGGLGAG